MGSRDHAWSIFCDIYEYKYREFSLKWNQGVGLGELLLAVTRSQLRPSRKTGTLLRILCNYYFTVPAGRGKPTAQPIRDNLSSANDKPPYLVDFLFIAFSPNSCLVATNSLSLLCLVGLSMVLP